MTEIVTKGLAISISDGCIINDSEIFANIEKMEEDYVKAAENGNTSVFLNLGAYYGMKKQDYDKMEKYYIMALKDCDIKTKCCVLINLGSYNQHIKKDYEKMKEYYFAAIEIDNDCTMISIVAMTNFGYYYLGIKDYENMEKYFLMAADKGGIYAIQFLGVYYQFTEKNYEKMKKYYFMSVENDDREAMLNLGAYYQCTEWNYEKMKKYYLMAIQRGEIRAMDNLKKYYRNTKMHTELLELVVTYPNLVKRCEIIESFNLVSAEPVLSKEENETFVKLFTSFIFNKDDLLCAALRLLIK